MLLKKKIKIGSILVRLLFRSSRHKFGAGFFKRLSAQSFGQAVAFHFSRVHFDQFNVSGFNVVVLPQPTPVNMFTSGLLRQPRVLLYLDGARIVLSDWCCTMLWS